MSGDVSGLVRLTVWWLIRSDFWWGGVWFSEVGCDGQVGWGLMVKLGWPVWSNLEDFLVKPQNKDHVSCLFHISSYFPHISSYFLNISSYFFFPLYMGRGTWKISELSSRMRGGCTRRFQIYPHAKTFGGRRETKDMKHVKNSEYWSIKNTVVRKGYKII